MKSDLIMDIENDSEKDFRVEAEGLEEDRAASTRGVICFICNEAGHIQYNCPTLVQHFVCSNCKNKGHLRKDCPNL